MKNCITLVLDASSSMSHIRSKTIEMANEVIATLKDQAEKNNQRTEFSLITFSDNVHSLSQKYNNVNIKRVENVTSKDYSPSGMTALYDALGQAIENYTNSQDYIDEDVSFVVIAITDGGENISTRFNNIRLRKLIDEVKKTDRFTITLQTPTGSEQSLANLLGLDRGNIIAFSNTVTGVSGASASIQKGLSQYYTARSTGKRSLGTFYANTDASHLTSTQVKRNLTDVSKKFDEYRVITTRGDDIKSVVEFVRKPSKTYTLGEAYYQLTKRETIQAGKEIVIQDIATKKLYAGNDARHLINLPDNVDAKVTPGDHGNYNIFVQSTSVNRKLVPGTKLLIKK